MAIELATNLSIPEQDLSSLLMLIYGDVKIGKSTFASTIPGAYFVATEDGHRHLSVYKTYCKDFAEAQECIALLCREKKFPVIVFDTITNFYDYVLDHVVKKHKCESINEGSLGYGKGYKEAKQIFRQTIEYITKNGIGVVMVGHEMLDKGNFHGVEKSRYVCNMARSGRDAIMPIVDAIGRIYMDKVMQDGFVQDRRKITFQSSTEYEAGDRSGILAGVGPVTLIDPKSGWDELMGAINNNKLRNPEPKTEKEQ